MLKYLIGAGLLALSLGTVQAAEVPFKGGATVTAVTGQCNWPQVNDQFRMYYFFPITGTDNGNTSTVVMHNPFNASAEGFQIDSGGITTAFQPAQGFHEYTRTGTYPVNIRFSTVSPLPTSVTTATQFINGAFQVLQWDNRQGCQVTFSFSLVRSQEN